MRILVMTKQHDQNLVDGLADNADDVVRVRDGDAIIEQLEDRAFSVVMLDGCDADDGDSLPKLVSRVRRADFDEPVVVYGVSHESPCTVGCLEAGADDVTTTDTVHDELLARVRAIVRRCTPHHAKLYKVGDLILDVESHHVTRGGEPIPMTPREMAVLERLMLRVDAVVTREEIAEHVWDRDLDPGSNLLDSFLSRVRRKIDRNRTPKLLHTVKGRGYMLAERPPQGGE